MAKIFKIFLINEEETSNNREVVLLQDAENTIDGACHQQGRFMDNRNKNNTFN